jgi:hypothetical protein
MPLVTRFSNQGNVFKEALEPNWNNGDLWSDTTEDKLKININGTATDVGQSVESHTFTTAETWTPEEQTGVLKITVDTTDMTLGKVNINVDGSIAETITSGIKSRLVNPSSSLTIQTLGATGNFDLSDVTYSNNSLSLIAQGYPTTVFFKSDGTKMYFPKSDGTNDFVYQYSLSTAWDVSTMSYDSKAFNVNAQAGIPNGLSFKSDGTKMYVAEFSGGNNVYQYSLSTAWDISTASYDSVSFSFGANGSGTGLDFKTDGTKMYVMTSNDTVYQYSLSTAWDISTASYDSVSFSFTTQDTSPTDFRFTADGLKLYMAGSSNDEIFGYTLSTAWDLSTISYDSVSFDPVTQENEVKTVFVGGQRMFLTGWENATMYEYETTGYAGTVITSVL